MDEKKRTLLLEIFLILLIVSSLGVALTYGRYSEENKSSGGNYGSNIEYIVADQIEVENIEEFVGAIENGYSNIIISNQADQALTVTAGVTDVGVDLIINLNGHQIVRNSRDPILNVQNGVQLTITDTSSGRTGSFYNPVGSVLQISGGTLTVSGGTFESGPRSEEYFDPSTASTANGSKVSGSTNATVYVRSGTGYLSYGAFSMPVITPGQTSAGVVSGNIYFEQTWQDNLFVVGDTYLYYVPVSGEAEGIVADPGSADFYYDYTDGNSETIRIYGYNDVKGHTDTETYATVVMSSGNMYARGGAYYSYFGVDSAYGIYAEGGYMAVEAGSFSVIEDGTCIRCNYTTPAEDEYLRIFNGSFRSEWGDTVQVSGGRMLLSGGIFEKDATAAPALQEGSAVIRVSNGSLSDPGRTAELRFTLQGEQLYGIYAESNDGSAADVSLTNATFDFDNGRENTGVYTKGGNILLSDTSISLPGQSSVGVRIESGNVTMNGVTLTSSGCGIDAAGGNVIVYSEFNLTTSATAILVDGGSLVFSGASSDGNSANATIVSKIEDASWGSDCIYVRGGSFVSGGTLTITHTGLANDDQYEGTWNNNNAHTLYRDFVIKSYAVRVESGEDADSTVRILNQATITNTVGGGVYVGAVGSSKVNVELGEEGGVNNLTVRTTGTSYYGTSVSISGADTNWTYRQSQTGGNAVEVSGGTLKIYGGIYSAAMGNGLLVKGGTVDVYGGDFSGNDSYGTVAGVAASYAFKVYGGTANIYSGAFGAGSSGSGAFVMGDSEQDMGNANIYGGTFAVKGQAGFSVYKYANILFAPRGGEDGQGDDITVSGNAAGIAVERTWAIEGMNCLSRIEIRGGTFSSTGSSGSYDGIWHSNPNAALVISGGTFAGSARSGLWFQETPNTGKISLSGGTYVRASNSPIGGSYSEENILENGYRIDKSNSDRWTIVPSV